MKHSKTDVSSKRNDHIPFEELKCAYCGKIFIPTFHYRFVDKKKRFYCKWTCYNHRAEKYPEESKE